MKVNSSPSHPFNHAHPRPTRMLQSKELRFSLLWCSVVSFTALTLICHQPNFICPGTPVSCESQGVLNIRWTVLSATGSTVLS
jgi:hypothetical protein